MQFEDVEVGKSYVWLSSDPAMFDDPRWHGRTITILEEPWRANGYFEADNNAGETGLVLASELSPVEE